MSIVLQRQFQRKTLNHSSWMGLMNFIWSSPFSVIKRKVLFNQRESFSDWVFHETVALFGWKVFFLFGTANWEEQLKIKSNWESTDITFSAWNRKCRRRKRLVLSRHIHIHVKLLIVTVLRDDTSCNKMALVLFFITYVPQACEESPDWEPCLVLARRRPSWICRRRGGRAPCKE